MKVLVLGAGGMAGHMAALYLQKKRVDVTAFSREEQPGIPTITGDIQNTAEIIHTLAEDEYDAIINCAGMLNTAVDKEPDTGIYLNSLLPHRLCRLTLGRKTRVIHLSTDCVFSGHASGGYLEDDFRDADTLYGRSKALGELNDGRNLTLRTSIVGPERRTDGVGLFHWFMTQQGEVSGYTRAIWTGVTTLTLAKAIYKALAQNLCGLYHLVNGEAISKFELLSLFNMLRENPVTLLRNDHITVNKSLVNTRTDFDFAVPSYADMVGEMGTWIQEHAALYPYRIKWREMHG